MNVLIACECSGRVRDQFLARGHDAWSCDLKPVQGNARAGNHIMGDALEVARSGWFEGFSIRSGKAGTFYRRWDLMIAHPDCTYLTASAAWAFKDGPYHQKVKSGTLVGAARREAREKAIAFFLALYNAPIDRIAIENPAAGAMTAALRKADQIIQPYQFGDDASKATGLWLRGLKPLQIDPAKYVPPRLVCSNCKLVFGYKSHKCPACGSHDYLPRWANQTDSGQNRLSPSESRAHDRAVTYRGIASAMADQWGKWE